MVDVGNLDTKLESYFELFFIIVKMANLNAMLWGYFGLYFIITCG
jgi:hypothetical protein